MNVKLTGFNHIEKCSSELFELSQFLHNNPELGFKEYKAHDYLCNFLESKNFKVERSFVLNTGFRAVYETAPRPHIVIMIEYDALPSIGHACGHNLIAEASVATGLGLMEIMKCDKLEGKITLLGTPGEETDGGKINFVSSNFFNDVDAAILSHPSNENVCNPILISLACYRIQFKGKEAHAACAPWNGKNALDAAVLAYQSLACLRQQSQPEHRLECIISKGGEAINIIPNSTEMICEIRTRKKEMLNELSSKVFQCFRGAAVVTGCEVEIHLMQPVFEDLKSNMAFVDIFDKNAKSLGVHFQRDGSISNGSSDVGNVSSVCPTIQPDFFIGTHSNIHTTEFCVTAGSKESQAFVLTQAKIMLATITDILSDNSGTILQQMKEEFRQSVSK